MKSVCIHTHSGVFHADDVLAVTVLQLMHHADDVIVVRSRCSQPSAEDTLYVVDIGMVYNPDNNEFDHHQADGKIRESGIKYSAVGLVWKKFGADVVKAICDIENIDITDAHLQEVVSRVDSFLEPIDAIDNGQMRLIGVTKAPTLNDIIRAFYPIDVRTQDDEHSAFFKAVDFATHYFKMTVLSIIKAVEFSDYVTEQLDILIENGHAGFLVLHKPGPFLSVFTKNFDKYISVKVIVYPGESEAGTIWYVRSAPGSVTDRQCSRLPAPIVWCGRDQESLRKLTGVDDALFINPSGFLGAAASEEGAVKLAFNWVNY